MDLDLAELDLGGFDVAMIGDENKPKESAKIEQKVIEDKAMLRQMKNEEIHCKVAQSLDNLCPRPKKNEQWRIITEKAFNAYAFIRSLLADGGIEDLYVAIYRINEPTVRSLIELIDNGSIQHATFIISSFFNQTKRPEQWAIMLAEYCERNPDKTSFAYLHNHAKIVCAKQGDNHYVFEGSGNMSDNARIEQYTYENNSQVYHFHSSWMREVIQKTR